jgi:hypothetical protein
MRYPVVVLGEGGQSPWTAERANQFARGGGKRVMFVCSTADCEVLAPPAVAILKRAGIEAKMISAGHLGHIVDDRVVRLIRGEWPWVVGDRTGCTTPRYLMANIPRFVRELLTHLRAGETSA